MKIVIATKTEIPDILHLNNFVQKKHANAHPDIFKDVVDPEQESKFFLSLIDDENNHILIVYHQSDPIGYIWVTINNRDETPFTYEQRSIYIHHIAVDPNWRRQNIGRLLIQEIAKLAEQMHIDNIALDYWHFNTGAQSFFSKLGFEIYNSKMWQRKKQNTRPLS